MRAVVLVQLRIRWLGRRMQVFDEKARLLNDTPAYDLVFLIQLQLEPVTEQNLLVNLVRDERIQDAGVGLPAELRRVEMLDLSDALRCDDDAVSVCRFAEHLTGHEQNRAHDQKMDQRLARQA